VGIRQEKGGVHDFKLYKYSIGDEVDESMQMLEYLGHIGIEKFHGNSRTPKKSSRAANCTSVKKHITNGLPEKGWLLSISTRKSKHLR
jgi:hypothetical protein